MKPRKPQPIWPPLPVSEQIDAHLNRLGMTVAALARQLGVTPNLIYQIDRSRMPHRRRKASTTAKGKRPVPQDRRLKFPVRLVEKTIKALKLPSRGRQARMFRVAVYLQHAHPDMAHILASNTTVRWK
jgi:transposase-like protein